MLLAITTSTRCAHSYPCSFLQYNLIFRTKVLYFPISSYDQILASLSILSSSHSIRFRCSPLTQYAHFDLVLQEFDFSDHTIATIELPLASTAIAEREFSQQHRVS